MERSRQSKGYSCVYQIESNINKNIYIGSAVDMKRRAKEHLLKLKQGTHVNRILQNHVNKYGIEDLDFSVVEDCSKEELVSKEQYWIDKLNPKFNICKIAGSTLGIKWKEESVQRQRDNNLGEKNPMFGVHKYGEEAPAYGVKQSSETCKKKSEFTKKRWEDPEYRKAREAYTHSEETLKKMHDTHIGKKQSEEEIANKRIRTKEAWKNPEYREAHMAGMKGKKRRPNHEKYVEAQKKWWSIPENRERQCASRKLSWEKRKKNKAA